MRYIGQANEGRASYSKKKRKGKKLRAEARQETDDKGLVWREHNLKNKLRGGGCEVLEVENKTKKKKRERGEGAAQD